MKNQEEKLVILTSPLSLNWETNGREYKAPNILQRVFSLFKNVRPGSDLSHFQMPPEMNIPKSQLQCYGESVYNGSTVLLSKCSSSNSAVERMVEVVAWSISTLRPLLFGVAPYNPILGETHHVSSGSLHVLLEQVSHHPSVTALHATDENNKVELIWCQHPVPKFHGNTIETEVRGKKILNLKQTGESYEMNSPKLLIKLLPMPGVEWVGDVKIQCQQTSLEAHLCYYYTNSSLFGGVFGCSRSLKGRIFESSSPSNTLFDIHGHWDRSVTVKSAKDGKVKVIYNAKEVISSLPTPIVNHPQGISESESTVVWAKVSKNILSKEWENAREAKKAIEEKQRELAKQRQSSGLHWTSKHFHVSFSKQSGWDCSPLHNFVPPAPIVVPI